MELKDMTVPQRANRIIALGDLIRTHENHLRKLWEDIRWEESRLSTLMNMKDDRIDKLNELREEKKLLEEEDK